jgi:hypothetical protein
VERVRDWPGIHCGRALADGTALVGAWYDRTRLFERNRWSKRVQEDDVAETETVILSPLPCWANLSAEEVREKIVALIEMIDRNAAERRAAEGTRALGARKVLRHNPHRRPKNLERSPARYFHTATREAWEVLRDAYIEFANQFREASIRLRRGEADALFPPGSFPPGLPFVPHSVSG